MRYSFVKFVYSTEVHCSTPAFQIKGFIQLEQFTNIHAVDEKGVLISLHITALSKVVPVLN
jgi:hypothetical protein